MLFWLFLEAFAVPTAGLFGKWWIILFPFPIAFSNWFFLDYLHWGDTVVKAEFMVYDSETLTERTYNEESWVNE